MTDLFGKKKKEYDHPIRLRSIETGSGRHNYEIQTISGEPVPILKSL